MIAADVDARALLEQLHLHLEGSQLPFKVVRLSAECPTAADDADRYQELDGILAQWMSERDCKVVIVRPDHYVFGGARTSEGALALLARCLQALNG
ncbi:3-(3-hydroxyphenyl)propionate hydroxylase [compost metagenome]